MLVSTLKFIHEIIYADGQDPKLTWLAELIFLETAILYFFYFVFYFISFLFKN